MSHTINYLWFNTLLLNAQRKSYSILSYSAIFRNKFNSKMLEHFHIVHIFESMKCLFCWHFVVRLENEFIAFLFAKIPFCVSHFHTNIGFCASFPTECGESEKNRKRREKESMERKSKERKKDREREGGGERQNTQKYILLNLIGSWKIILEKGNENYISLLRSFVHCVHFSSPLAVPWTGFIRYWHAIFNWMHST